MYDSLHYAVSHPIAGKLLESSQRDWFILFGFMISAHTCHTRVLNDDKIPGAWPSEEDHLIMTAQLCVHVFVKQKKSVLKLYFRVWGSLQFVL